MIVSVGQGDGQNSELEQRLVVELRRGVVALAVLSALRTPTYGYSLQQRLTTRGFDIDQGTLYPLLRRLDEQGLLQSDWTVDETRPRKYYRLSERGVRVLDSLATQWGALVNVVSTLLSETVEAPAPGSADTADTVKTAAEKTTIGKTESSTKTKTEKKGETS
jgi:DNA-binding PadR family transcriptional regulator